MACIFSRLLLQAVLPTQPAPRVSSPSTSTSLRSILLASLLINNNKTARIPFCKSISQTQRCNADGVEEADHIVSLCLPLKLLLAPCQLSEPDRREHRCPAPRPLTKSKMAAVTGIRQRGGYMTGPQVLVVLLSQNFKSCARLHLWSPHFMHNI